jgi:hypothetical protein
MGVKSVFSYHVKLILWLVTALSQVAKFNKLLRSSTGPAPAMSKKYIGTKPAKAVIVIYPCL